MKARGDTRGSGKGRFVFVLGRPGAGKSEFCRRFAKRLLDKGMVRQVARVDDYQRLWEIFREEETSGAWRRCEKMPGGGYKVTDPSVWDEVLRRVAADAVDQRLPHTAVFIEFARPSYVRALMNFPPEMFHGAFIVYVDCPFETCWTRNSARQAPSGETVAPLDDHFVSREEMEATFASDDKAALLSGRFGAVTVVDNSAEGADNLWKEVDRVIKALPK